MDAGNITRFLKHGLSWVEFNLANAKEQKLNGDPEAPKIPEIVHDLFPVLKKHVVPALGDDGAITRGLDKILSGKGKRSKKADPVAQAAVLKALQDVHGPEKGREIFERDYGGTE